MFEAIGELFRTATPWISAGLNLFSTIKSFDAAEEIEDYGQFNQRVFQREAEAVWRAYEDKASILADEQRRFLGTQRASFAKSGVELTGTPADILADTLYRQRLDQTALRNEAEAERLSRLNKGAVAAWEAGQEGSSIRSRALSNFAASLLDPSAPSLWQPQIEAPRPEPTYQPMATRRGWNPAPSQ